MSNPPNESTGLFSLQNTVLTQLDPEEEDALHRLLRDLFCDYIENQKKEFMGNE